MWEDPAPCGQQHSLGRGGMRVLNGVKVRESKQAGLHAFIPALDCGYDVIPCHCDFSAPMECNRELYISQINHFFLLSDVFHLGILLQQQK